MQSMTRTLGIVFVSTVLDWTGSGSELGDCAGDKSEERDRDVAEDRTAESGSCVKVKNLWRGCSAAVVSCYPFGPQKTQYIYNRWRRISFPMNK